VVNDETWVSLVIFGSYEELPDIPAFKIERELTYELLQRQANWWEPGYAKTIIRGAERPLEPVYFRIRIARITGHRSVAEV
jgi:nitroimidazol reductase NimA-like FMN-containing flavoprotein (pyridoxamine 5'-phosphate oxidase superfamily)